MLSVRFVGIAGVGFKDRNAAPGGHRFFLNWCTLIWLTGALITEPWLIANFVVWFNPEGLRRANGAERCLLCRYVLRSMFVGTSTWKCRAWRTQIFFELVYFDLVALCNYY